MADCRARTEAAILDFRERYLMARRRKFQPGDRFRGKADHVRFEPGEESWVMSNWIEKV
jgi:hypothetical protein